MVNIYHDDDDRTCQIEYTENLTDCFKDHYEEIEYARFPHETIFYKEILIPRTQEVMDTEQTEQEDTEVPDSRQAKKQNWSHDKESDSSENTCTRPTWVDWSKRENYEYAEETKFPYKKAWDEASTKSESKWTYDWVDNETKAEQFWQERQKDMG